MNCMIATTLALALKHRVYKMAVLAALNFPTHTCRNWDKF